MFGLFGSMSISFRAARIVAANRMANFQRRSSRCFHWRLKERLWDRLSDSLGSHLRLAGIALERHSARLARLAEESAVAEIVLQAPGQPEVSALFK